MIPEEELWPLSLADLLMPVATHFATSSGKHALQTSRLISSILEDQATLGICETSLPDLAGYTAWKARESPPLERPGGPSTTLYVVTRGQIGLRRGSLRELPSTRPVEEEQIEGKHMVSLSHGSWKASCFHAKGSRMGDAKVESFVFTLFTDRLAWQQLNSLQMSPGKKRPFCWNDLIWPT